MKRRRYTPEQVIRKLREADRLLGEGKTTAEVARALEISENTYHRWRNQFGGMKADGAKRLKELERENTRLKAIVADKELEVVALREVAKGTGEPSPPAPGGRDGLRPPWCQLALGMSGRRPAPVHAAPGADRRCR